ncbi:MAG: S26 family signal peptidase, partial [Lachnospiraceae bacterium]|nr:S26 family signal peptidase [Lachnospiraceae bacterium]
SDGISYAGLAAEGIRLGEGEYFVLGDNREVSEDSRYPAVGKVRQEQICGRVLVRIWPLSVFGAVD